MLSVGTILFNGSGSLAKIGSKASLALGQGSFFGFHVLEDTHKPAPYTRADQCVGKDTRFCKKSRVHLPAGFPGNQGKNGLVFFMYSV